METTEVNGFRTIGNLTRRIGSSLKGSALTPTHLRPSSSTTGAPLAAGKRGAETGQRYGVTVAVTSARIEAALRQCDPDPAATDQILLASLPPAVKSSLVEKPRDSFGDDGQYDGTEFSYSVSECSRADLDAALILVETALTPSPVEATMSALARLRVLTKARPEADDDMVLLVEAYAEELAIYPQDIVCAACREWARRNVWFPSYAEMRRLIDKMIGCRHSLLLAIRRGLGNA